MVMNNAGLFERRLVPCGHNSDNFAIPLRNVEIFRFKASPPFAIQEIINLVNARKLSSDQVSIEAIDDLREIDLLGLAQNHAWHR